LQGGDERHQFKENRQLKALSDHQKEKIWQREPYLKDHWGAMKGIPFWREGTCNKKDPTEEQRRDGEAREEVTPKEGKGPGLAEEGEFP